MSDDFEKRYTAEERKRANDLLDEVRMFDRRMREDTMGCIDRIESFVAGLLDELDTARYHASCGEDDLS